MRSMFTIIILCPFIYANNKDTCQITKTFSCDEYESDLISKMSAFGKQGPQGTPGKDCNMTLLLKTMDENAKLKKDLRKLNQG